MKAISECKNKHFFRIINIWSVKMLVVGVIFKAFALTGRKVDCWFTQGECPGLGASAPSGRVGVNLLHFFGACFTHLLKFCNGIKTPKNKNVISWAIGNNLNEKFFRLVIK